MYKPVSSKTHAYAQEKVKWALTKVAADDVHCTRGRCARGVGDVARLAVVRHEHDELACRDCARRIHRVGLRLRLGSGGARVHAEARRLDEAVVEAPPVAGVHKAPRVGGACDVEAARGRDVCAQDAAQHREQLLQPLVAARRARARRVPAHRERHNDARAQAQQPVVQRVRLLCLCHPRVGPSLSHSAQRKRRVQVWECEVLDTVVMSWKKKRSAGENDW